MSGASVSSFSSAHESTASGLRPDAIHPGEDDNIFDEPHTVQLGIFGVLYTVSKEKELTSVKFAFFRLLLDFLQLWLLVVNPAYGWAINGKSRVWEVVSFIQLNSFLNARGYTFFLGMLYVFVGLLGVNLALSVWVAHSFSNNRFEYVWPIQFLRWFGLIFYQVLDIATLTLLLVTLDCNYFSSDPDIKFHNQEFPDIMCWSMPHIVHVAVSVASILLFFVAALAMVLSEMELNPLTKNYMAIANTRDEGICFTIKTILTIASVTLSSALKVMVIVYVIFFLLLFYLYVRWVPFIYSTLNYVRCASYGTVLYSSGLLVVLAFGPSDEEFREKLTLALWVGMAPAAVVGALFCHMRLRHFNVVLAKFRDAEPGTKSKAIHRFGDVREVAIAARCCRQWVDEDTLEPEAVALSEQVIKAGITQLPNEPRMIILYSSFLIDVQGSYQSGYTQLQAAKKQSPGVLERFAIFSREQEHAQKASGASNGDSAVDLVSYVEFQRNHRLVVKAHREALLAIRAFWGLLLRSNVNFNHLSRALHRIEVTVKAAERAYRSVLIRHTGSARIVRLYGKFLESVKFDPWAASKWFTEADRLEEEAEHSKEALQLGGIETLFPPGAGLASMEGVAFICINAQGIIQVASNEAHTLLGYGKNELKGKDVGIIMPAPFCERHTAYVRNYIQTGTSAMLGKYHEVPVISKTRHVFPVKMHVSKVSGLNEDSVFLGVLEPLPPSANDSRLWVVGSGVIVAADECFCDWLGYDPADVAGKQVEELLVDTAVVHEAIKSWNRAQPPPTRVQAAKQRRHSSNFGEAIWHAAMGLPSPMPGGGADGTDKADKSVKALSPSVGEKGGLGWLRRASFLDPSTTLASRGGERAGEGAAGGPVTYQQSATMVLPRAEWRHKYQDALEFDTFIQPGAIGNVRIHSITIRRSSVRNRPAPSCSLPAPYYHDMLLVADPKGRVLHVTRLLAAALGRTPEAIRSGGLSLLIPEPTSVLHGPWLQELANPQPLGAISPVSSPPFSCRSGVAVSLTTFHEKQGHGVKQFRLSVQQRLAEAGAAKVHVVALEPLSPEQAVSERRLRLTLDLSGTILAADEATPAKLFGADPRELVGSSISQLVDLFQLDEMDEILAGARAGEGGAASGPAGQAGAGNMASTPGYIRTTWSGMASPGSLAAITAARDSGIASAGPAVGAAGNHGMSRFAGEALRDSVGGGPGPGSGVRGGRGGAGEESDDVLQSAAEVFREALSRRLTRALLQLGRRSAESPGCSWRVGVSLPPDEQARAELEQMAFPMGPEDMQLAAQLYGAQKVPAVMTVRLVRRKPPPTPPVASESGSPRATDRFGMQLADINGPRKQEGYFWDPYLGPATGGAGGGATPAHRVLRVIDNVEDRLEPRSSWGPGGSLGPRTGPGTSNNSPVPFRAAGQQSRVGETGLGAEMRARFLLPQDQADPRRPGNRADQGYSGRQAEQQPYYTEQGVWAPVSRIPVAEAAEAVLQEAAAAPEGAIPDFLVGPALLPPSGAPAQGAHYQRDTSLHRHRRAGPVAEATETGPSRAVSTVAGGSSRTQLPLSDEDEAALESLVSQLEEPMTPAVAVTRPGAASQPAAPAPAVSRGASVLAAAVAAAVDKSASGSLRSSRTTSHAGYGLEQRESGVVPTAQQVPSASNVGLNPAGTTVTAPSSQHQLSNAPAMSSSPATPTALAGAAVRAAVAATAATFPPNVAIQLPPAQATSALKPGGPPAPAGVVSAPTASGNRQPVPPALAGASGTLKPASLRLEQADPPAWALAAGSAMTMMQTTGLVLEVELWRADLLSGVLEVDEKGRVLTADAACPLGRSGLVLGGPATSLSGRQVSELMPLPPGGVAALLEPLAAQGPDSAVRGALKKRTEKSRMGPPVTVTVRHNGDGCALDVMVQAVRRAGPLGSAYLCLRPASPTLTQPGFARWLYSGDTSGLMPVVGSAGYPTRHVPQGGATQSGMNPARALTNTGLAGMFLADKAASAAATPLVGRDAFYKALDASGMIDFNYSSVPPPPPPQPSALPLSADITANPLRVTTLRGGSMPSRLSNTTMAGAVAAPEVVIDEPMGAIDMASGPLSPKDKPIDQVGVRATSMSLDTAYDPSGARGEPTLEMALDGSVHGAPPDLKPKVAAGSAGAAGVSAREGAALASAQDLAALGPPGEAPRKGKLSDPKQSMIQSWVLSGGNDGGLKSDSAMPASPGGNRDRINTGNWATPPELPERLYTGSNMGSGGDGKERGAGGSEGGGSRRTSLDGSVGASSADGSVADGKQSASGSGGRGYSTDDVGSEAGAHVANYSVGKRFKRLQKLLTSPMALHPARQLRWRVTGAVAVAAAAHTVTFVLLLIQLLQQQAAVNDLHSVSEAARKVHEIAINARVLDALYTGNSFVEGLPQFGEPAEEALAAMYDDLKDLSYELKDLHHGVYLGFHSLRRIPTTYGLRDVWDNPRLNVSVYTDLDDPTRPKMLLPGPDTPVIVPMGLWDAGNVYYAKTLDLINNGPRLVAAGLNFTSWSTWRFIRENGVAVIFPAYLATLDALVEITVAASNRIYKLQLIVLILEGGLLCMLVCIYVWLVARKYSRTRHELYGVFIQIPVGVTRGLANMSLVLEGADGEEDEDNDLPGHELGDHGLISDGAGGSGEEGGGMLTDGAVKAAAAGEKRAVIRMTDNNAELASPGSLAVLAGKRRISMLTFAPKGTATAGPVDGEDAEAGGSGGVNDSGRSASSRIRGLNAALTSLMVWRKRARVSPASAPVGQGPGGNPHPQHHHQHHQHHHKHKRHLLHSNKLAYAMVAPFLVLGAAIIAVNLVGYYSLEKLAAPIATLNIVNVVVIRFHRILFYLLEVTAALSDVARAFFKTTLREELEAWKLEYMAMLYGNEVVPHSDTPHFRLADVGVLFGGYSRPGQLLYHTTHCLASDPAACQPPDSPYYEATHNGLDVLLRSIFGAVETLLDQPLPASNLNSTEFSLLWATGQTDAEGGLTAMSTTYLNEVQGSYRIVIIQQIVMFVVAWVLLLAFILFQVRPVVRKAQNEMRRVAELLSQLPGEVDCEALVSGVILRERSRSIMPAGFGAKGGTTAPGGKAGHAPETVGAAGGFATLRRRSSAGTLAHGKAAEQAVAGKLLD